MPKKIFRRPFLIGEEGSLWAGVDGGALGIESRFDRFD